MKFTRDDWTLFRSVASLGQRAGVPATRLRRLIAKELVDNALDAAGACEIGRTETGGIFVQDGGPGIPGSPEEIASIFSIKRPLVSSKVLRLPTRGALGNGARVVAGAVLASGGRLEVWNRDQHLLLRPQDSGETLVTAQPADFSAGFRVEVTLGDAIPEDPNELLWADLAIDLAGDGPTYRGRTSGWWYDEEAEWLQDHRVELNAMTTSQFLQWLDRKIELYGDGKVIPPRQVLNHEFEMAVSDEARRRITERVLREANVDQQVRAIAGQVRGQSPINGRLEQKVIDCLQDEPTRGWREPVEALATEALDATLGHMGRDS